MRTKTGIILAVAGAAIGVIAGRIMENMSAEKDLSERIDNTGSKDLEDYLYEHYYGADFSDEDDKSEDEIPESDITDNVAERKLNGEFKSLKDFIERVKIKPNEREKDVNEDPEGNDTDKAVSFIVIDWKNGRPVPTKMTVEEFEKKYGGL